MVDVLYGMYRDPIGENFDSPNSACSFLRCFYLSEMGEAGLMPPEDLWVGWVWLNRLLSSPGQPFLLKPHWSGKRCLSLFWNCLTSLNAGPPVIAAVDNLFTEVHLLNPCSVFTRCLDNLAYGLVPGRNASGSATGLALCISGPLVFVALILNPVLPVVGGEPGLEGAFCCSSRSRPTTKSLSASLTPLANVLSWRYSDCKPNNDYLLLCAPVGVFK